MSINYYIIIAVTIISILELVNLKVKKEKVNRINIGIVLIAIVICIMSIYKESLDSQKEQYKSNFGEIDGSIKTNLTTDPILAIGETIFNLKLLESKTFFNIGGDNFDVWIEDNKLKVSITLRD